MKDLLDRDVCIYLIIKRPSSVLEKLHACRAGDVGVSTVTVAELRYGASISQRSRQNHEALDLFLAPLLPMEKFAPSWKRRAIPSARSIC